MSVLLNALLTKLRMYVCTYMHCEGSCVLGIIHTIVAVLGVWACTREGIQRVWVEWGRMHLNSPAMSC